MENFARSSDFSLERAARLWADTHGIRTPLSDAQSEAITRHLSLVEQSGSGLVSNHAINESRDKTLLLLSIDTDPDDVRADTDVQAELVESYTIFPLSTLWL
jgi:hypothetical protein